LNPLENKKILVIDDARPPRKMLKRLLNDYGSVEFFEVDSIKNAKTILSTDTFNLIFCDYRLQDATSKTLLLWLKATENSNAETPIVIISSDLDKENIMESRSLGVKNFLVKPFNCGDLFNVLSNSLSWDKNNRNSFDQF